MTAELKVFVAKAKEKNDTWIFTLEEALQRAKSGECVGGAVIESTEDTVRHYWCGLRNRFEFAGLLQRLIHEIMAQ